MLTPLTLTLVEESRLWLQPTTEVLEAAFQNAPQPCDVDVYEPIKVASPLTLTLTATPSQQPYPPSLCHTKCFLSKPNREPHLTRWFCQRILGCAR